MILQVNVSGVDDLFLILRYKLADLARRVQNAVEALLIQRPNGHWSSNYIPL